MPSLPTARGDASALLLEHLLDPVHALPRVELDVADALTDDDLQLALYLCYELHYRGLAGVDERWEWDPGLLALRAALEAPFEDALRAAADDDDAPPLSRILETQGTLEQVLELVVHRSAYQLKEADPHSWA